MAKKTDIEKRPVEAMQLRDVQQQILVLRGEQVLLDFQLAKLYGVETRVLKQAVNRNIERFPSDFMFILTQEERNFLISMGSSQIVIPPYYNFGSSTPYAFTEQGVAMLSSVLKSPTAVQVNIEIMRAFIAARRILVKSDKHNIEIHELRMRMKMLENALEANKGAVDNLSAEMKEELKKIYKVLGMLSERYIASKERKPIGYEAIDAERKAKTNKENNEDN